MGGGGHAAAGPGALCALEKAMAAATLPRRESGETWESREGGGVQTLVLDELSWASRGIPAEASLEGDW